MALRRGAETYRIISNVQTTGKRYTYDKDGDVSPATLFSSAKEREEFLHGYSLSGARKATADLTI